MSKKQALILFFSAILLGFLMIQPFNYICRLTDKCYPVILSYYLPKSTGKERYEVFFITKNYSQDIQFKALSRSVVMYSGDDVSIVYQVKNTSNHDIKIRPMPYVEPKEVSKHIKFYECLCAREHKIKAGDSINLMMRLNLDREIEQDPLFNESRVLIVGYEANPI
ncbi:MAG: hypothetical protein EXR06_02550 [Rickettsiales bacterium]|nr:hypothetical protein [Rickettsiales bacterium]